VQLDPDSAEYAIATPKFCSMGQSPMALQFLKAVRRGFGKLPEYQYKLALGLL